MEERPTKSLQPPYRELLDGRADLCEVVLAAGPPGYRVYGTRKRSEHEKELAREGRYGVFPGIDEPTELVPPVDWLQDPFGSRSWRAQLHTLRFLDVLFQMYFKDGDREALGRARDLVLDWIAQNPPSRAGISEYAWWDKVVGDRAPFFAYLLGAGCQARVLEPMQATTLLRSLIEHAEYLVDDRNYTHQSNHGLFQDAGLLILTQYLGFLEESRGWREHARARFLETISRHVDVKEGMHLEHSPEYQYLTLNLLTRIRELAEIDDPWLATLLERMRDAGAWFVLPDGTVPPIGDSDRVLAPKSVREAAKTKSGLKAFPSSGWAVVRSRDSALITSAGYHSHAHKHVDDLSFYLYERGEPVIVEAGKYGYDPDAARSYALSSAAHNGLIVDGEAVDLKSIKPYGSGIEWTAQRAGWFAISGRDGIASANGVNHRRLFLYRPGLVLIVLDQVSSGTERTYKRLFHLSPQLEVSGEANDLRLSGTSFNGSLRESSCEAVSGRLVSGQHEPVLQGWVFPEYRSWEESWTVEYESRCMSGYFATALSLQDGPLSSSARQLGPDTFEIAVEGPEAGPFLIVLSASGLELGTPGLPEG